MKKAYKGLVLGKQGARLDSKMKPSNVAVKKYVDNLWKKLK